MPQTDTAYPIIDAILRVVPVSRWAFARIASDELAHLLRSDGTDEGELAGLRNENARQREVLKAGPRIAAMLGPLDGYDSGITLLFADARTNFGILTMMRSEELGLFTSAEIAILTLALDSASEQLRMLRLNATAMARASADHHHDAITALMNPAGEEYVLDGDLQIVMTWTSQNQRRAALTGLRTRFASRLSAILEQTVSELTSTWRSEPATQLPGVARPVPFLVVRTQPVAGPSGLCIGVRINRFEPANSLVAPAARFRITPRELEVLALLLDGAKVETISDALSITASTVQDHIKNMVEKTESRNRTELIARVLGWGSPSETQ